MKKLSRKTGKKITALALCMGLVGLFATTSCDKIRNNLNVAELSEAIKNMPCNCIMDTLKGEWSWFKTYGGLGGKSGGNRFESVIKILGQNTDGSINYEIWIKDTLFAVPLPIYDGDGIHFGIFVDDTLFYKGSFQAQGIYDRFYETTIKLPHLPYEDEWYLYLYNINDTNDIIMFYNGDMDGFDFYYQRIKQDMVLIWEYIKN